MSKNNDVIEAQNAIRLAMIFPPSTEIFAAATREVIRFMADLGFTTIRHDMYNELQERCQKLADIAEGRKQPIPWPFPIGAVVIVSLAGEDMPATVCAWTFDGAFRASLKYFFNGTLQEISVPVEYLRAPE